MPSLKIAIPAKISFSNLVPDATIHYRIQSASPNDATDTGWLIYAGEPITLNRMFTTHLITTYAEKPNYIKSVETTLTL